MIFDMSVTVKRLLYSPSTALVQKLSSLPHQKLRLVESIFPKLMTCSIGKHSGNSLQFDVSIHSRRDVSNAEKLAYLRHSLKDGSAKARIVAIG